MYREHTILGQPTSRSWDAQLDRFNKFLSIVEKLANRDNCIIMGDYNVNLDQNYNENHNNILKNLLLETLPMSGFTQLVNGATRFSSCSNPSLIDHAWCNNLTKHIGTKSYNTDSDHDLIITDLKIKGKFKLWKLLREETFQNSPQML